MWSNYCESDKKNINNWISTHLPAKKKSSLYITCIWRLIMKYLLNEWIVFVANFSSQQGKLPLVLKHHLRFMYKKNTTTRTHIPSPAPKTVVSIDTAHGRGRKKTKKQKIFFSFYSQFQVESEQLKGTSHVSRVWKRELQNHVYLAWHEHTTSACELRVKREKFPPICV